MPPEPQQPRTVDLAQLNYKVKAVSFTVHLDIYDNQGRQADQINSQPQTVFEAAFFPGLKTFLRSQGFVKGWPAAPQAVPPPPSMEAEEGFPTADE